MTRDELVGKARGYIKEAPYPNPNEFTRWFWKDNNSHAWCGAFINFIVKQDLSCNWLDTCTKEKYVGGFGYVPSIVQWAKDNGYWSNKGKKGDLVVYNWNPSNSKEIDHIGILADIDTNYVISVDGNTTNGKDKENCVAERKRDIKYVVGYVNLPYKEEQEFEIGDQVIINGNLYRTAYDEKPTGIVENKLTYITRKINAPHPYNTTGDLGWMNTSDIKLYEEPEKDYKELYEQEVALNEKLLKENCDLLEINRDLKNRIFNAVDILTK